MHACVYIEIKWVKQKKSHLTPTVFHQINKILIKLRLSKSFGQCLPFLRLPKTNISHRRVTPYPPLQFPLSSSVRLTSNSDFFFFLNKFDKKHFKNMKITISAAAWNMGLCVSPTVRISCSVLFQYVTNKNILFWESTWRNHDTDAIAVLYHLQIKNIRFFLVSTASVYICCVCVFVVHR